MKKYLTEKITKKTVCIFVIVLAMMLAIAAPIQTVLKLVICAVLCAAYLYVKRADFIYNRAVGLVQAGQPALSVTLFAKALECGGLSTKQLLAVGSVFVQFGREQEGIKVLSDLRNANINSNVKHQISILISIGYWNMGDADSAIAILQDLVDDGNENESIVSTLCAYLLDTKRFDALSPILPDRDYELVSTGMLDNYLWYYMSTGFWDKADAVALELKDRDLKFPEVNFHLGVYSIHARRVHDAKEYLAAALGMNSVPSAIIKQDFIQRLHRSLEDSKDVQSMIDGFADSYADLCRGCSDVLDDMIED